MVTHTKECLDFQAQLQKAHDDYAAQWPNHCKKCGGWGGFTVHNYPREPDDFDLCSCVESGICPRCGERAWEDVDDDFDLPCSFCGWKDGTLGCPEEWEGMCDCGLDEWIESHENYSPD